MTKFISWVEIPATDFERAVKFYNSVFDLGLEGSDFGHEKMACFPDGEGAISFADGFEPGNKGPLVSLDTGSRLDEVIVRIKENKGEIIIPKTKIDAEGRGYFAVFIDSEGNKMGLYGDN